MTAHNMRLPDFVLCDIKALEEWDHHHALKIYATCLRNAGWSGRAISKAFKRNVNWAYNHHLNDPDAERSLRDYRLITGLGLTVPAVPPKPTPVKVDRRKNRKRLDPVTRERLLRLKEAAKNFRGTDRNREAAQEYVAAIWHLISVEGFSTYTLAIELGVTHAALQTRLVRYGYATTTGKSGAYRALSGRNPATVMPQSKPWTHCKRGHPLSGDNVRNNGTDINGNPIRTCKTCSRERARKYYHAKKRPRSLYPLEGK
jgi:hypothetical protein